MFENGDSWSTGLKIKQNCLVGVHSFSVSTVLSCIYMKNSRTQFFIFMEDDFEVLCEAVIDVTPRKRIIMIVGKKVYHGKTSLTIPVAADFIAAARIFWSSRPQTKLVGIGLPSDRHE